MMAKTESERLCIITTISRNQLIHIFNQQLKTKI
jgi:hypothetical protein